MSFYTTGKYIPSEAALRYHEANEQLKKDHPDCDVMSANWGVQTEFLVCEADMCLYGGAAGGGKSFAGLLYPLQFVHLPNFRSVMFRRETTDLTKQGGLQEEAQMIYEPLGGKLNEQNHTFKFRNTPGFMNPRIALSHMQHEKNTEDHKGAQYCLVYIDEATTFSETMHWFLFSRARTSTDPRLGCPMIPMLRMTTNPDPDSFLKVLYGWWIDPITGKAIKERSGIIRWLVRHPLTGEYHWFDTKEEGQTFMNQFYIGVEPELIPPPISGTFIHAEMSDNPFMTANDMARIATLDPVMQARQREGDWNIREAKGTMFQPEWIELVDECDVPKDVKTCRGWDIASSEPKPGTDPDSTSGTLIGYSKSTDCYYIMDNVTKQAKPNGVHEMMRACAERDGKKTHISFPQDPGSSGVMAIPAYEDNLKGYKTHFDTETGSKTNRFRQFSAACYFSQRKDAQGNFIEEEGVDRFKVKMVRGAWNQAVINQCLQFPDGKHDDVPDSISRAFNFLKENKKSSNFGKLGN